MKKIKQSNSADVARLAGVSKSAVSRAYNGGYVAPEVRERIFEAARKLRYRPSLAARALSTNRSNLIGLSITALDNQFYPELVDALSDALNLAGFRIVLFTTRGQEDLEPMLDELLGARLDGVILASTAFATRVASECVEAGMPVVMLNNIDLSGQIAGVTTDNRHGAEAVAAHLAACGYKQLAVIKGLDESSASVERTRHFCDAAMAAGLPMPSVVEGFYTYDGARAATRQLLDMPVRPDAIFCVTDFMAFACLQELCALGMVAGRDIGVCGFDDVSISGWPLFDLTTYHTPKSELVEMCVAKLISAIDGHPLAARITRLTGRLVVRGSTR